MAWIESKRVNGEWGEQKKKKSGKNCGAKRNKMRGEVQRNGGREGGKVIEKIRGRVANEEKKNIGRMKNKLGKRKSEEREIMVKEKQLVEGGGERAKKKKMKEG